MNAFSYKSVMSCSNHALIVTYTPTFIFGNEVESGYVEILLET